MVRKVRKEFCGHLWPLMFSVVEVRALFWQVRFKSGNLSLMNGLAMWHVLLMATSDEWNVFSSLTPFPSASQVWIIRFHCCSILAHFLHGPCTKLSGKPICQPQLNSLAPNPSMKYSVRTRVCLRVWQDALVDGWMQTCKHARLLKFVLPTQTFSNRKQMSLPKILKPPNKQNKTDQTITNLFVQNRMSYGKAMQSAIKIWE